MTVDSKFLRTLRLVGLIEGCSTLILFFVAMPLKYMADLPLAVTIAGSVHGLLFTLLCALFLMGSSRVPLSPGLVRAGILGAVVPFGPFVVDARLKRLEAASPGR